MLFDELTLKDNYLNLDVKKTSYSNSVEINILPYQKNVLSESCKNQYNMYTEKIDVITN